MFHMCSGKMKGMPQSFALREMLYDGANEDAHINSFFVVVLMISELVFYHEHRILVKKKKSNMTH